MASPTPSREKQVRLTAFDNEPMARLAEQRLGQIGIPCLIRPLRAGPGLWGSAYNFAPRSAGLRGRRGAGQGGPGPGARAAGAGVRPRPGRGLRLEQGVRHGRRPSGGWPAHYGRVAIPALGVGPGNFCPRRIFSYDHRRSGVRSGHHVRHVRHPVGLGGQLWPRHRRILERPGLVPECRPSLGPVGGRLPSRKHGRHHDGPRPHFLRTTPAGRTGGGAFPARRRSHYGRRGSPDNRPGPR